MTKLSKAEERRLILKLIAFGFPISAALAIASFIGGSGSPGPNSQGFLDKYLRKDPTNNSHNLVTSTDLDIKQLHLRYLGTFGGGEIARFEYGVGGPSHRWDVGPGLSQYSQTYLDGQDAILFQAQTTDDVVRWFLISAGSNPEGFGAHSIYLGGFAGSPIVPSIILETDTIRPRATTIRGEPPFGTSISPVWNFNSIGGVGGHLQNPGQIQLVDGESASSHVGSGAQVGLPTGSSGTLPGFMTSATHRHAFSGRFGFSGTDPAAILPGGVFPDNFARIKINNNWTLRRIWAYTKNGPTGGTETYGLVNVAGALQGTAVILPAGPGVSQAESALQVTNLTGGTLYYLAQTAAAALVTIASVNIEVGIEYTMNV